MSDTDVEEHTLTESGPLSPQISQATARWASAPVRRLVPAHAVEHELWRRRGRVLAARSLLLCLDAVMINLAFLAAYVLRFRLLNGVRFTTLFIHEPLSAFYNLEWLLTVGVIAAFWMKGLYRIRIGGEWFKQFWTILGATMLAFAVYSTYQYVVRKTNIDMNEWSRSMVLFTWVGIVALVSATRLFIAGALAVLYRRGIGLTNLLVVGSGRLGKLMMQHIAASPHLGYRVVGFLHDQDGPPTDFGRFHVLGQVQDLDAVIAEYRVAQVIIALPSYQHDLILHTMRHCERAGADFRLVPHLYELSLSRIDVDAIQGVPLIGLKRALTSMFQYRVKRMVDIVGASALLVLCAPVWLAAAVAIALDSPGPVLLRQPRVGRRGVPFTCYKFRSMHLGAEAMDTVMHQRVPGAERGKFKLREDPRRTRVGRFIRRSSIDELPQLLNVLAGTMSLVGPRPPLLREYACYENWEKARLEMLPGITGLWQVRGRSDLDFNEMVLMDLYYIEHWSLRLDLQILVQTIPAVLGRRGAY